MPPSLHPSLFGPFAALAAVCACLLLAHLICKTAGDDFGSRGKRLGCIDGLRGYLALGVFFHHFAVTDQLKWTGRWEAPPARFFQNCGQAGVALFFMITGFLFLNRLLEGGRVRWGRFYVARAFRLIPLYWVCVALIAAVVFTAGGATPREPPARIAHEIIRWLTFAAPDINGFAGTRLIIAGVTWTLKYEWVFYFALPLVAWALRKKPLAWILAALTAYLYFRPVFIPRLEVNSSFFILFLAGGLIARAYRSEALRRAVQAPVFSVLGIAALAAALFCFDDAFSIAPILLLAVFFLPVALGNSLWGFLNLRGSLLLGEISYGIYLLHGLVLYLAFSAMAPGYLRANADPARVWPWMTVLGLIVVPAAWLGYRCIERPGMALGKKLAARL